MCVRWTKFHSLLTTRGIDQKPYSNFCAKVSLLLPRRNHNNQVRNLGIEHKSAGSATLFLFCRRPEPEQHQHARSLLIFQVSAINSSAIIFQLCARRVLNFNSAGFLFLHKMDIKLRVVGIMSKTGK
jgi:hypothetical protein